MKTISLLKPAYLLLITNLMLASCHREKKSTDKYYRDYSFVTGQGIEPVSSEDTGLCIIVRYADSSYQEIISKEHGAEDCVYIQHYRQAAKNLYYIKFNCADAPPVFMGNRYFWFQDSCLHRYMFGLPTAGTDSMEAIYRLNCRDICSGATTKVHTTQVTAFIKNTSALYQEPSTLKVDDSCHHPVYYTYWEWMQTD